MAANANSPLVGWKVYSDGEVPAASTLNQIDLEQDLFARGTLKSLTLSAAPGSPADGDMYYVSGTPAGGDAWENHGGELAWYCGSWQFKTLKKGDRFFLDDGTERTMVWYYEKSSTGYWMRERGSVVGTEYPVGVGASETIVWEKTISTFTGPTAGSTKTVAHGITSLDVGTSAFLEIEFRYSDGTTAYFSDTTTSTANLLRAITVDATNLKMTSVGFNFSTFTFRVKIRYTKTTGL